jgi:hypothetical protein
VLRVPAPEIDTVVLKAVREHLQTVDNGQGALPGGRSRPGTRGILIDRNRIQIMQSGSCWLLMLKKARLAPRNQPAVLGIY